METVMMNMVRIFDGEKVLVLDKKKKFGWEGLTFPGGKVEPYETFYDSVIREAKEETNLDISNLEYNGCIQWYDHDDETRFVGLLYTARHFEGQLVKKNREGNLFFEDYDFFKKMDGHSESMEYVIPIFDGKYTEISLEYKNGKIVNKKFINK